MESWAPSASIHHPSQGRLRYSPLVVYRTVCLCRARVQHLPGRALWQHEVGHIDRRACINGRRAAPSCGQFASVHAAAWLVHLIPCPGCVTCALQWSASPLPVIHSFAPWKSCPFGQSCTKLSPTAHTNAPSCGRACRRTCRAVRPQHTLPISISITEHPPIMLLPLGHLEEDTGLRGPSQNLCSTTCLVTPVLANSPSRQHTRLSHTQPLRLSPCDSPRSRPIRHPYKIHVDRSQLAQRQQQLLAFFTCLN